MIDACFEAYGIWFAEFPILDLESERWAKKILAFLLRKLRGGGSGRVRDARKMV